MGLRIWASSSYSLAPGGRQGIKCSVRRTEVSWLPVSKACEGHLHLKGPRISGLMLMGLFLLGRKILQLTAASPPTENAGTGSLSLPTPTGAVIFLGSIFAQTWAPGTLPATSSSHKPQLTHCLAPAPQYLGPLKPVSWVHGYGVGQGERSGVPRDLAYVFSWAAWSFLPLLSLCLESLWPSSRCPMSASWERDALQGLSPSLLLPLPRSGKLHKPSTPGCCVWHAARTGEARPPVGT